MRYDLAIGLSALSVLAACGSTPEPAEDAGPDDARIAVPDTGAHDAFVPQDAGDGICGDTSSSTASWAPAPAACLPRCSAETRAAYSACANDPCRDAALAADTTPTVRVRTITGVYELGCAAVVETTGFIAGCLDWQEYSCMADHCPEQFDAWTECVNGSGLCGTQTTALRTCMSRTPPRDCVRERTDACFVD